MDAVCVVECRGVARVRGNRSNADCGMLWNRRVALSIFAVVTPKRSVVRGTKKKQIRHPSLKRKTNRCGTNIEKQLYCTRIHTMLVGSPIPFISPHSFSLTAATVLHICRLVVFLYFPFDRCRRCIVR